MKKHYHILNGDALKERFPSQFDGEILVMRECLVEGDVTSDSLNELFEKRARYIAEIYGEYSIEDYYEDVVTVFEQTQKIPDHAEINLWFEDDLFCQVNFWFITHLLSNYVNNSSVFLIRPPVHTPFGFGGLGDKELIQAYTQKIQINNIDEVASLWHYYQKNALPELINLAKKIGEYYPFIETAVEAHIQRIPEEDNPGRPVQTLIDIMNELETDEFPAIFREFSKRESIYGYGDLQVRKLLEEIRNISRI